MKNFHVIDSVSHAYLFVWKNKERIARYSALPILIKIGCLALVLLMGASQDYLRQGLLMLPAHFAEGWFAATIIMICMQTIPAQSSFLGETSLSNTQRLNASIALYVIIQLIMAVIVHISMPLTEQKQNIPASPAYLVMMITLLVATIWAFRLSLLSVPIAMGYSIRRYLRCFKNYNDSFYMIGLSLICTVPVLVVMVILLNLISNVFAFTNPESLAASIVFGTIQIIVQIIALALTSAAMTYAFYPILNGKGSKT